MGDKSEKKSKSEYEVGQIHEELLLEGGNPENQIQNEVEIGADGHPINPDQVQAINNADFATLEKNKE